MKTNIIMFFISLAVFTEAHAIHYNNCAAEVSGKASQCSEDLSWSNAKNTNTENGVGKLFILPISSQMNVWLFDKNHCKLIRNTGNSSIAVPVNTFEEFRNFNEDAVDQISEDSCSNIIDNVICGDPAPPITCVQKRIYYPNASAKSKEDPTTYYCDGANETYTYEQVILKERHANNQIYCMNYEAKTISVTRDCHHCQYDNSWSPGKEAEIENEENKETKRSKGGGGGHGVNAGLPPGEKYKCPGCKLETDEETGSEGWGNPSGGSIGKKAKK